MNVLLIIAIILIGILPILYELRVKIFDFFNVKNLFIAYFLIILPISGYVSLATNDIDPIINLDTVVFNIYYTKAILATLVGLVCFQLGYYGTGNKSIKVPAFLKTTWISTNLSLLYWTFFIVGIGSFLLFLSVNGGLSNFLKNREYFRSEGVSGQGIYMYPSTQLLAFSAFLFFFNSIIIKNKVISFFRSSITIAKVFTFFIICITPSLVFGFRSLTGIFILQFLVIWNYGYKVIPFQKIIFILILLMACFSFYGIYREIPVNEKVSFNSIQKVVSEHPQIVYGILTRVKGTETVAAVIKRLETTKEYDLGYKSVYEALTVPIPHSIWKSKPIPSSVRFTTYFFGDQIAKTRGIKGKKNFGGIPSTVIGEAIWHFGWIGVVLVMFSLGVIFKKVYYTFKNNRNNFNVLFIYAIIFPNFVLFPEMLQGYVNGLILTTLFVGFIIVFLKLRIRFTYSESNSLAE